MVICSITLLLWTVIFSPSCSTMSFRSVGLYGIIILSGKCCLSLPGATPPRVWAVGWVGYVNYDKRTDMKQQYLSHKIMTMYNSIRPSGTCLETCHCVILRNVTLNSSHWWMEIATLRSVFRAHQFGRRFRVVCLTSSGHMVLTLWNSSLPHVSTSFSSHNRHSFHSTLAVTNTP